MPSSTPRSRWHPGSLIPILAQAFYREYGFVPDGAAQVEDGVREIRMFRDVQHVGTGLR